MNLAVSFLAQDTSTTYVQIFCDQTSVGEATMVAPLSFSSNDFKIGDLFHGYMKLFKMFISPMGSETFTHVTTSKLSIN